ncbi:MAG: GTP cyclohydrolase I FolE [Proteobacteria bacterium]|nr:GTP cyclohydrolase I FolE [Pseudomonadota bacterium]
MKDEIKKILIEMGEDPTRHGLLRTPERVQKSYEFLTSGYKQDPVKIINSAIFQEEYDDMIIVKDIEMFSLCEHHLLPFFGRCHVAYIPDGRILGISKIPRLVDVFAKRLQVQERLTNQIAHTLYEVLKPKGVGVVIEAKHMCMVMRGVEKQNSFATTSSMLGVFRKSMRTREEFLRLVQKNSL